MEKIQKNENQEISPRNFIYPPSFHNLAEMSANNCILVPLKEMMRSLTSIRRFLGTIKAYRFYNSVSDGVSATNFPTEFLDSVELSGLLPYNLELQKGSPIILMRNLNPPRNAHDCGRNAQRSHRRFQI